MPVYQLMLWLQAACTSAVVLLAPLRTLRRLSLHCETLGSHLQCCGSTSLGHLDLNTDMADLCAYVAGLQGPMQSVVLWAARCA